MKQKTAYVLNGKFSNNDHKSSKRISRLAAPIILQLIVCVKFHMDCWQKLFGRSIFSGGGKWVVKSARQKLQAGGKNILVKSWHM